MSFNHSFSGLDNSFEASFQNLNRLISLGNIDAARQLAQQLAALNAKQDLEDDSSNESITRKFLPYNSILYVPFIISKSLYSFKYILP